MKTENKRKYLYAKKIAICLLFISLFLIVGGTYAVYSYYFTGNQNIIETNDIKLEFLESNDEIISMVNAIPETDDVGITEDSFEFVVTSKTKRNMSIGYTLSIEKLSVDSGYTSLTDSDIKIYLTDFNDTVLVVPTLISNLNNYKLYDKIHTHNSSAEEVKDKYKLRAWIDNDTDASSWDETTKLQYKFKIRVDGSEMVPLQ